MVKKMKKMSKTIIRTLNILFLCFITSCTIVKKAGYSISENQVKKIKEEESTIQDCLKLLGTPSFNSSIKENTFYYMSYTLDTTAIRRNKIRDMKILVLEFKSNILQSKYFITEDNMRKLIEDKAITKVKGSEMHFFEQLIDNAGKFRKIS